MYFMYEHCRNCRNVRILRLIIVLMAFVNEAIIRKKYNGGNSESSLFSDGLGISERPLG